MIDAAQGIEGANIIAVEQMAAERIHMYGVVGVGERAGNNGGKLFSVTQMVEKPKREAAPSNLIITGRYILQPEIFDILATEKRGAGGEIQLTDAMIELASRQPYGLEFAGRSFDCGSKVGSRRQRRLCARARRHRTRHARGAEEDFGLNCSVGKIAQPLCSIATPRQAILPTRHAQRCNRSPTNHTLAK